MRKAPTGISQLNNLTRFLGENNCPRLEAELLVYPTVRYVYRDVLISYIPASLKIIKFLNTMKQQLTLKERGKAPPSFYITVLLTFLHQYLSGVYSSSSLSIVQNNLNSSIQSVSHLFSSKWIKLKWNESEGFATKDCIISVIALLLVGTIIFVLVWSPFRAGMWTGKRAQRFQLHRYGGLCFLCLYGLAWVEFISNYHSGDNGSTLLPHLVAFNGR